MAASKKSHKKSAARPATPADTAGEKSPAGFYSQALDAQELKRITDFAGTLSLDDEIWLVRCLSHRLAEIIRAEELPLPELLRAGDALVRCTGRIASLLRDKRALSGEAADGLAGAVAQVLDELSNEWGVPL
jgi:hypothetical protein